MDQARNAEIDGFISTAEGVAQDAGTLFSEKFLTEIETLNNSIEEAKDAVQKRYEADESVLDEDVEGELERLEALEEAASILGGLQDDLDTAHRILSELAERFDEVKTALQAAKEQ